MATFIFGENKLKHPVFVTFSIGYKYLRISQSVEILDNGSKHAVVVLHEQENARKQLKEGIKVSNKNGDEILVKLKTKFIIEKLEVFINGEKIPGHEFIEFNLSFL